MKGALQNAVRALMLIATLILASEVILAVVFYSGGIVTRDKAADLVKVLQGKLVSPPEAPVKVEAPKKPVEIKTEEELRAAVAEWRKSKAEQEGALAAEKDSVASMKRELENVRQELDSREQALKRDVAAFDRDKAAEEAAAKDRAFLAAVATYTAMKASDVAQILSSLPDEKAVRYLKAFKTGFAAEVLSQIKKLDDQNPPPPGQAARAVRLLEMLSGDQAAVTVSAAATAARK